jgi:hypothetical protein
MLKRTIDVSDWREIGDWRLETKVCGRRIDHNVNTWTIVKIL